MVGSLLQNLDRMPSKAVREYDEAKNIVEDMARKIEETLESKGEYISS